jgi:hypothetical protein
VKAPESEDDDLELEPLDEEVADIEVPPAIC